MTFVCLKFSANKFCNHIKFIHATNSKGLKDRMFSLFGGKAATKKSDWEIEEDPKGEESGEFLILLLLFVVMRRTALIRRLRVHPPITSKFIQINCLCRKC